MAEPDKYIIELSQIQSLDGTEAFVCQTSEGGEGSTVYITATALKEFMKIGLGTMIYVNEPPDNDQPYVRKNGEWVALSEYLGSPLG
jgi:hypothetical protein